MDKELIKLWAKCELARREFFFYCNLKAPKFYKLDRKYLFDFCNELQDFYYSEDEILIVNMPPRHGKSRTIGLFTEWTLGRNQQEKIMTGSYNEKLSTTFSKNVRNGIQEIKADKYKPVFSDVFPNVHIKRGDGAMNLWSLENGYNNYLATSPTGTATGFGATLLIIDDLIKTAEEAHNENVKDGHWTWFTDTMLSRLEENGKIIIIMTRWASDDLAGKILEEMSDKKIRHINMKALQDDGTMLCSEILSLKSYKSKIKHMGVDIASANYQQEPIDLKGRLYTKFKTYDGALPVFKTIRNYTDTADTGADYLCSIDYGITFSNEAYILDVIYTQKPMEDTEPATAKMLLKDKVGIADIESNNGGRGFARNVKRILKDEYNSNAVSIKPFTQSKNKIARILSNATWVMEHIYYPKDWKNRFPEFYNAMIKYQRAGKNKHDDAPDAITGICETILKYQAFSFN